MSIQRVCVLGLGEVGSTLAHDLLAKTTLELRLWDHLFEQPGSVPAGHLERFRGERRIERAENAGVAARDCDVILSVVTAGQSVAAAKSILPSLHPGAWFIEFNSVSPGTKNSIHDAVEAIGGWFVEAAIMSPIQPLRSASPVLLSGPRAQEFAAIGQAMGFAAMTCVSATPGVASATKLCRSVMVKGLESLVSESLLAARYYGVDEAVLASLDNLLPHPDWQAYAHYLVSRTLQHGARRSEEMQEAARMVAEAGIDPWMSDACARRQAWAHQLESCQTDESISALLDAMRGQLSLGTKDQPREEKR